MAKTSEIIILSAIELFNTNGVNNVRLQDIAKHAGISAGNLAYHYNLKKDLIEAVQQHMTDRWDDMRQANISYLDQDDYINVTKAYITFQINYRFFYRDILDIIQINPSTKDLYQHQIQRVIKFSENSMYLAVGKGYIISEPHSGHFRTFAKNTWAILNSALTERAVFGKEEAPWERSIEDIWELHYPYLTEKGKEIFYYVKEQLPQTISGEVEMIKTK